MSLWAALLKFWFQTDLRGENSASYYRQGRQLFLIFLTMVTHWSRSTSNFLSLIGQNLNGEVMRKNFTDSWSWQSFASSCDVFTRLFPLDVQNEIQLLSLFFCYHWLFFFYFFIRFLVEKWVACLFEWEGQEFVLVVDYFSRYCEIGVLRKSTSQEVINHLKAIFARHGIPETVISDNGPQYSSAEFAKFAEDWGFTHITSSPKYPQSNGEAERMVQTTLKTSLPNPTINMKRYSLTELPHLKTDSAQPNYAWEGDYAPPFQLLHLN